MLRPSFARNVVRLRTTRAIHSTASSLLQTYASLLVQLTSRTTVVEPVATETQHAAQQLPSSEATEATEAPAAAAAAAAEAPRLLPNGMPNPETFPLYRPPPPSKEPKAHKIDIATLPTEEEIDIQIKEQITADAIKNVPEYTEEDLREFYKNVVLSGAAEQAQEILPQIAAPEARMDQEERTKLLSSLQRRLTEPREDGQEPALVPSLDVREGVPQHMALTAALMQIAPEPATLMVPLGLVTRSEWRALFESFLAKSDPRGAEVLLSTMERHGVIPTVEDLNEVIDKYASSGQTSEVARLIQDFEALGLPLSDFHRDMVIKSTMGPEGNTDAALPLLRQAEEMGQPFPQSSYNLVLSTLVDGTENRLPDTRTRAQALDLFAHMRFAAHPTPTRELYTTMIRMCGASTEPQPERARDWWIEMTVENEIQPTAQEYNAIIGALGSTKTDYLEAYDLLRQMLSMHDEATMIPFEGNEVKLSPWVPTLETFSALLQGTKRAGDLDRARWVLNEMVDLARAGSFSGHPGLQGPDEQMMTHIFQTYAAWQPRIKRGDIKPKAEREEEIVEEAAESSAEVVEAEEEEYDIDSQTGPSSHNDAVREAKALFDAIVAVNSSEGKLAADASANPFREVKLTTKLVNSYVSVLLSHSRLQEARQGFKDTWAQCETTTTTSFGTQAVLPNGYTYLHVLERCARGMRKEDRDVAQEWGREAWNAWRKWKELADTALPDRPENRRARFLLGLGERQVEKVWVAAIRLAAIGNDTETALGLLNEFVHTYPPEDVRSTYEPYVPPQFAIRMTTPDMVGEPAVPPHILFRDIDVLHNKLVRDEKMDGIRFLKWACSAYERSLATRRKWRQRSVGVARVVRSQARERGEFVPKIKSRRTPLLPTWDEGRSRKRTDGRRWDGPKSKRSGKPWDHSDKMGRGKR